MVEKFLNNNTMYRLVLYYLIVLSFFALVLSFLHLLPFGPLSYIISLTLLLTVSIITNSILSKIFNVKDNTESIYISALILGLIITPIMTFAGVMMLFWAAFWAMTGKYVFAIGKKHIFNPAALAVFLTATFLGQSASWWVGTSYMLPVVLLGGVLMVKKIDRANMISSFFIASAATILGFTIIQGGDLVSTIERVILDTPILFFAFVMLTEPLTTPPRKKLQNYYGALIGILFAPQIHLGSFYTTPEIALLIGNIYSFLISTKKRFILTLKEKIEESPSLYNFIFSTDSRINFLPGQYLEITLAHKNFDSRGERRYFTISSSPTEKDIQLGIKFASQPSSFKRNLLKLNSGNKITATSLMGDFVLPKDPNQKCVFIAGGIGITPFRSMIKYLLDKDEKREITLFYSTRTTDEIMYKEIFDQAKDKLGAKIIYLLTGKDETPSDWTGKSGKVDKTMIAEEVPNYKNCIFYLSGPSNMVKDYQNILQNMGVKKIITDYFPGF